MTSAFMIEPKWPEWERFGTAAQASARFGCACSFMDALETGQIKARAVAEPSEAGKAAMAAAGSLTPAWWTDHLRGAEHRACQSDSWMQDDIEVEQRETLQLIVDYLEERRRHFADRYVRRNRRAWEWNHVDALAWVATGDIKLLQTLRDFAPGTVNREEDTAARREGLQYVYLQIVRRFCRCGAKRPLLPIGSLEGCRCLQRAWDDILHALQGGLLHALFVNEAGLSEQKNSLEFLRATLDLDSGRFAFDGVSGELRFLQSDVQTAAKRKNFRRGEVNPFSKDEIFQWIDDNPQFTNQKSARNAFMCLDRAKGLSAAFEKFWTQKKRLGRGRPSTKPK